jgi:hypothetical protein
MANGPTKSRLVSLSIWVVMLLAAWSLPVLALVERAQEKAAMASEHYYKPGKPAEWYAQQQAIPPQVAQSRGG